MFKNRSKILFVCALLATLYVIYLISYFTSSVGDMNSSEEIGGAIATALVTPHIVIMGLGAIFSWLGFFLRKSWGALVGAILYCVGALMFILYAVFCIPLIVLGFIASTISSLVKKAGLSSFDRLLGVVFGVVRGILIVSAVFAVLQILIKLHILSFITYYPWYKDSIFVPHLEVIVEWFFNYLGTSGTGAL